MIVLSIDPGACAGWAVFLQGVLVSCGLSKASAKSPAERIAQHANNLASQYAQADLVVCERGTWRGGGKGSMTAAQLADFNVTAGQLAGRHGVLYTPDEWKGRVPKDQHQPRILEALEPAERALIAHVKCGVKARMDLLDAVGIGCYHLGRLQRQPAAPRPPRASKPKRRQPKRRVSVSSRAKTLFKMSEAVCVVLGETQTELAPS